MVASLPSLYYLLLLHSFLSERLQASEWSLHTTLKALMQGDASVAGARWQLLGAEARALLCELRACYHH